MPTKTVTKGPQTQTQDLYILILHKTLPSRMHHSTGPNIPAPCLIFWHLTTRAPRWACRCLNSEMLDPNSFAHTSVSDSISVLQHLTGVINVGQVAINTDVADGVKKVLTQGLDQEIRTKLNAYVKLPSNCEQMEVLKCNPKIYQQIFSAVKWHDKNLQSVQKTLLQGISALALALSSGGDSRSTSPSTQQLLADALALSVDASHRLDKSRRCTFETAILEDFKTLCTYNYPQQAFCLAGASEIK